MRDATNNPLLENAATETSETELESDNAGSANLGPEFDTTDPMSDDSGSSHILDDDATEGDLSIYEQSGVSLTYLHGVFYTPPGFNKIRSQSRVRHSTTKRNGIAAARVDHDCDSNLDEKEINIPAKKKLKVDDGK